MVRPCFPCVCRESQMPDVNTLSEVGDLVDWWTDYCFWSGRITEKLGDEKVKIELPPLPVGEGSSYEVFCKDLRPSLDWSLGEGWKLLVPKRINIVFACAQIVKPLNQDKSKQLPRKSLNAEQKNTTEKTTGLNIADHEPRKISCADSVRNSHIQDTTTQMPGTAVDEMEKYDERGASKKMKIDQSICLNSTSSDTIEAAILDLEELICRVKWLKNILEFGTPLPDAMRSSWTFIQHRGSSTPK
ncbi:hypothetical protein PTKIN_Ptkin09bG0049300 [Pterospermum kingtungense]